MGCGSSTIAPTPANTKPKASPVKTPQSNNDDLQTLKPKSDKRIKFGRVPKQGELDSAFLNTSLPPEFLKEFGIDVPAVDAQHAKLVGMVNSLQHLAKDGYNDALEIIGGLLDYTEYHFKTEELLMREVAFPTFNEHVRLHGMFTEQVMKAIMVLEHGDTAAIDDLITFLSVWLTSHIKVEDKRFGEWFASVHRTNDAESSNRYIDTTLPTNNDYILPKKSQPT